LAFHIQFSLNLPTTPCSFNDNAHILKQYFRLLFNALKATRMTTFETALKKYLALFADQEMVFINDARNLELFKKNSLNTNLDEIRTKISALNDDPDIKQLSGLDDMANHIMKLNVDDRIKQSDLSVVEDIANITVNGKAYHFLHFASLYCNLHRPDIFPIYSEQHFPFYREYIKRNNLKLDPDKLNTYAVFSAALDDLLTRTGVKGKMNYLHIRKFGWLYIDHVMKEASETVQ